MFGAIIVVIAILPVWFFILQVLFGLVRLGLARDLHESSDVCGKHISSVILVPAHNEENVLQRTIVSIKNAMSSADGILIIADNCTDKTADIARLQDCSVVERFDDNKGKGFALDFGMQCIHNNMDKPDCVIVIDADCEVSENAINDLKLAAMQKQSPVQGSYLIDAPKESTAKQKVSAFAIYLKNFIRPLGIEALGGAVPITGSGFCVPYDLISRVDLASGEIVEDMKLGVQFSCLGCPCKFSPSAQILSSLPLSEEAADTQRQRWEHGHIGIIQSCCPLLLRRFFLAFDFRALLSFMDLIIPPLTLLLVFNLSVLVFSALFLQSATPVVLSTLFMFLFVLLLSNISSKPVYLTAKDIGGVFLFVLSKFNLYHKLIAGRKSEWVKTERED